tara:strand:- start:75 stop:230 length:156 start_codon:yes stop_codon:yes gene_type:complete
MGNMKKAAGLAGKLARKGLDKADEARSQAISRGLTAASKQHSVVGKALRWC